MDIGRIILNFVGAALVLALGGVIMGFSIKAYLAPRDPNLTFSVSDGTTTQTTRAGRQGLWVFIVLGGLIVIAGIGVLIWAITVAATP